MPEIAFLDKQIMLAPSAPLHTIVRGWIVYTVDWTWLDNMQCYSYLQYLKRYDCKSSFTCSRSCRKIYQNNDALLLVPLSVNPLIINLLRENLAGTGGTADSSYSSPPRSRDQVAAGRRLVGPQNLTRINKKKQKLAVKTLRLWRCFRSRWVWQWLPALAPQCHTKASGRLAKNLSWKKEAVGWT